MGKKLDALLGRGFKSDKFKATANLAVSRLSVLKNQRHARCAVARSDVVQLLGLGHHDRALLRVEHVMKEQNMLDVFVMVEGYCHLLIERLHLLQEERVCPDELKEAVSSLIYASTRCGDLPELQQLRAVFTSRFGKEFVARAVELRNNCGVNTMLIKKLSTRMPSFENRLKVLKEIASENNILLQIEEEVSETTEATMDMEKKQDQPNPKPGVFVLPEEMERIEILSDRIEAHRKYKDVADAAQAAFKSAAYAAAAARAAVELSRSETHDPGDPDSPSRNPFSLPEKMPSDKIRRVDNYSFDSEDEEVRLESKGGELGNERNETEVKRSISVSSSDSEEISVINPNEGRGDDIR